MTISGKKKPRTISMDVKMLNDTFWENGRFTTSNTGQVWSRQIVCTQKIFKNKTKLEIYIECARRVHVQR